MFGYGLSLSCDGNSLAVGAPKERSVASGIGGDQFDLEAGYHEVAVRVASGSALRKRVVRNGFEANAGDHAFLDRALDLIAIDARMLPGGNDGAV